MDWRSEEIYRSQKYRESNESKNKENAKVKLYLCRACIPFVPGRIYQNE